MVGLFVGCTTSDARTPVMQQPDSGQPLCNFGLVCPCAGGLQGVTTCNNGQMSCDCSRACQQFPAHTTPTFTACGGDPTGTWNWKETDNSQRVYHLQTSILGPDIACDAFDFQEMPPSAFILTLSPGGTGSTATTTGATTFKVTDFCIAMTFGQTNGQRYQSAGCDAPDACGICKCSRRAGESNTSTVTWNHTNTDLTYTFDTSKQTVVFKYCVDGNTLTLFNPRSQIVQRFEGL
jgi:hypothetical protein